MNKKIAVLGDLHFDIFSGLKQERMYEFQEKFFRDVFFPTILEQDIKTVVQLGDVFDVRVKISQRSLAFAKRVFFDVLRDNNIKLIALVGNHDIFYKDSMKLVTAEQVLGEYENITSISKPTQLEIYGDKYSFIPWICKENEKEISHFIEIDDSDVLFGHLELAGGKLNKYSVQHHGSDIAMFKKYTSVYSGHFHTPSQFNNVMFVGTPYEITKIDSGEQKSFLILEDGQPNVLIENNNRLYEEHVLESESDLEKLFDLDLDNKYIDIKINFDIDQKKQEKLSIKLSEKYMIYELNIVTKKELDQEKMIKVDASKMQSNLELIGKYAKENNLQPKVQAKLEQLFHVAEMGVQ